MGYDKLIKYDYKIDSRLGPRRHSRVRSVLHTGCLFLMPLLAIALYVYYPEQEQPSAAIAGPVPVEQSLTLPAEDSTRQVSDAEERAEPASIEKALPLQLPREPDVETATSMHVAVTHAAMEPLVQETEVQAAVAEATQAPVDLVEPEINWKKITIGRGDNLSLIFSRLGLSPALLYRIINHDDQTRSLKRVMPGQKLMFHIDGEVLKELRYLQDQLHSLHIRLDDTGIATQAIEVTPTSKIITTSGEISSSLFLAAMNAGLSDNLTMQLAEIFGWDIDFALDIRQGDRFSVIYEELYKDSEKIRDGAILAAEFINQGKRFRAVRYEDADGHVDYYADNGDSMRKAFLRTPVKFSRISSGFSSGRKHPVLNKIRAHKGVDYAAPRGTPVKAAGDGKVTLAGRKGGYGKTVVLQHGGAYSTLYAHLNAYAKGVSSGKHVRQGQIIGYVGSSGLATGPHLHYEFRVNGVHRNPLTVKLPKATPIPEKFREDFQRKTVKILALLEEASMPENQRLIDTPSTDTPSLAANEN